jgi:hypothetical protein
MLLLLPTKLLPGASTMLPSTTPSPGNCGSISVGDVKYGIFPDIEQEEMQHQKTKMQNYETSSSTVVLDQEFGLIDEDVLVELV